MIEKIEKPITPLELNNKVNEIIDGLGVGLPVGFIFWGTYSEDYVPENALYCGDGTELSGASGQMFRNLYVDYLVGKNSLTNGITITGNLMNANGVLSNFSGSNYFNLNKAYSKVVIAFKLSDVTTKQMLYTDEFLSYSLRIEDGALNRYYYSAPNTITKETVCPLTANANYELHLSNLTDGKYKTIGIYKNGSLVIKQSGVSGIKATSNFGYGLTTDYETSSSTGWADATVYPLLGTIDLNNSYYEGSKLDTCSYSEYETEVTMTGSCYKWAVDTANEKFRIPFIPDKVLVDVADTIGVRGNDLAIGLTNGTNNYAITGSNSTGFVGSTADYGKPYGTGTASGGTAELGRTNSYGLVPDSSKSGIDADAATAKTYKTIRHYVVVATGSVNQTEADWSEFASSLKGKANTDLSNTNPNASFRRDSVRWGIPDYEQMVEIEVVSNGTTTYAAAYDGIFWGKQISSTTAKKVKINGHKVFSHFTNSGTISNGFFFPVYQGDIITVENTTTNNNQYLYFAPYRE